jgi:tRNA A-37 threonylcarbamoyl transferase component Bud32
LGQTQPPAAALAGAPVQVAGYEILGELGRGGMGVVYKARQTKLGRVVALKMILAGGHAGASDVARFRTEAEAVARLQHPNIVQIFEVGDHGGLPFLSLEFCPGGSLDRKLNGTPIRARDAAELVEKLARAVQAAHEKGVLHRDLKPANVLLAEDGAPKITDFGLAKKLDAAGQTQSGAVLGTPSYMAPEQASGKSSQVGPAADVYALGAILYECLTGRPPFKAATSLDTILQAAADEPVAPRRLQSTTPRDLDTMCLKCLRKETARRYRSALELAEELRRFLDGEPIQARPPSPFERARRWAQRRPAVAALLAVLLVVLTGGFAAITRLWLDAEGQRRSADAARRDADDQRRVAESARDAARSSQKTAEDALAESRRRLALNYLAYGRACATASRLANAKDWLDGQAARAEFQRLADWLRAVGDPAVKPALDRFSESLARWTNGSPPPVLQRESLDLAHACRDSWLNTVDKEFPTLANTIRSQLYKRACHTADQLAGALSWEGAGAARQEFWELYWGELAIVESAEVESTMVAIGGVLRAWRPDAPAPAELREFAAALRRACGDPSESPPN